MRSLHGVVESLEHAALDIGRKLSKIDVLEASAKAQEKSIGELKELLLEQAGDIGSLAAEMQQLREMLNEILGRELPFDRRPTTRMPAVSLDLLKGGGE